MSITMVLENCSKKKHKKCMGEAQATLGGITHITLYCTCSCHKKKKSGKNILAALKKAGLKVEKPIKVKLNKKRWAGIDKFCKDIQLAHKQTAKSTLNFGPGPKARKKKPPIK